MDFKHTPETLEAARIAREAKKAKFLALAHLLIPSFQDAGHWARLASKYSIRMPSKYLPCSELKYARRAVRKLGIDYPAVFDEPLKLFPQLNPTWPAYAHIGLILEAADELADKPTGEYADIEDLI